MEADEVLSECVVVNMNMTIPPMPQTHGNWQSLPQVRLGEMAKPSSSLRVNLTVCTESINCRSSSWMFTARLLPYRPPTKTSHPLLWLYIENSAEFPGRLA